jgi:hypothetical protein
MANANLDIRYERAYDRARASSRRVWWMGLYHYRVASFTMPGIAYDIHITRRGLICNCPAGQAKQPCKHAALVSLRLQREHRSPTPYEPLCSGTDNDMETAIVEALPSCEKAPEKKSKLRLLDLYD